MRLTEEELIELRMYLLAITKYRETYNEIYDHVLNALEHREGVYSIGIVRDIVIEDFGTVPQIEEQEVSYQKQVNRKFSRLLWKEMLNTFKFPQVAINVFFIIVGLLLYLTCRNFDIDVKIISKTILYSLFFPALLVVYRRFFVERRRIKISVIGGFLNLAWMQALLLVQLINALLFGNNRIVEMQAPYKFLTVLLLFFVTSVYVRAFVKLYQKKIRILTA